MNNRISTSPTAPAVTRTPMHARPWFGLLRGSLEQTKAAAKEFKVFFAKAPGRTPDSYTIDHTAGSFVFDPKRQVRLFGRYGGGAEALASDLKLLLEGA